ncbi:hypothetical protein [Candidatus Harpocratesius sp.]
MTISQKKISTREMQVLMALEQKPLGTYEELAKISNISKSVVFGILRNLENPENLESPYFTVTAHPNLINLGLEIVDVIATISNRRQLVDLIKIGIAHPYTVYQALIYGSSNGMLNQFRIPIGSHQYIDKLFSKLEKERKIESYSYHRYNPKALYNATKVSSWNPETNSWDFSWKNWFESDISKINNEKIDLSSQYPPTLGRSKKWIKRSDLAILSELTANTRRKNIEIMEALVKRNPQYEFTPQTFGRHLKRINDECISYHRVFFHALESDQTNAILIQGYATQSKIKQLIRRIRSQSIPFNSVFKFNENEINWFVKLPASKIHPLLPRLLYYVKDLQFFMVDSNSAYAYQLYPGTFDESKKDWIVNEKFMVDNVIDDINIDNFFHDKEKQKIYEIFGRQRMFL